MSFIQRSDSSHDKDIDEIYIEKTRKNVFGFFITRSRFIYIIIAAILIFTGVYLVSKPRNKI